MKRPGDGISPMKLGNVINKIPIKDLPKGHKLSINDLDL